MNILNFDYHHGFYFILIWLMLSCIAGPIVGKFIKKGHINRGL